MARKTSEIKKTMTDAFMADETIREKYGLSERDTFNGSFSSVSLENILFFIVSACCHVLEMIFDQHKVDVESKISMAVVASVPWYYKTALAYQHGDGLVLNETTQQYEYAKVDESKQVVKYAAVRDKGTSVQVLVSGDDNGKPVPLSDDVLMVFKEYMNRVKVAGVILNITSAASDKILINAKVYVDPLVIGQDGFSISDGTTKPVEKGIEEFLKSIKYGGTFNKTKLVDAIQDVPGVTDVELGECLRMSSSDGDWMTINGNNYAGASGSYIAADLQNTIAYVQN